MSRGAALNNLGRWFLVFNLVASAACGLELQDVNGTAGAAGNGGSGGSTGGGGGAAGDDGTPKPPPAQGALSIHVDAVDPLDPIHGNSVCPPGPHWANVPYQRDREIAGQTQHTTENDAPVRAVSGEAGDRISCRVAPRGTAFQITAEVTGYAEFDGQKRTPTVATISIPAISADQIDGIGVLTLQDDATRSEFTDQACVFSTRGGSLDVAAGRIWAALKCEYLEPRATAGQACRVNAGVVILENCTQ